MPLHNRKVLKVNTKKLLKHLRVIETHGIVEQGSPEAVRIGREVLYWQKGTQRVPLSPQEVSAELAKL